MNCKTLACNHFKLINYVSHQSIFNFTKTHENVEEEVKNEDKDSNDVKNNAVDLSWIEAKNIKAATSFNTDDNHNFDFHKDNAVAFQLHVYDVNSVL